MKQQTKQGGMQVSSQVEEGEEEVGRAHLAT